jgi:hypothetical protein
MSPCISLVCAHPDGQRAPLLLPRRREPPLSRGLVRSAHSLNHNLFLTLCGRDEYLAPIPEQERADIVLAYHAQLNSVDDEIRLRAARAWTKWEMTTSKLIIDTAKVAEAEKDDFAK